MTDVKPKKADTADDAVTSLLLIGCGKMGGTLLDGWLAAGITPSKVHIVDPSMARENVPVGCTVYLDRCYLPVDLMPTVAVFAVKPQLMDAVLPAYSQRLTKSLLLSIAAGRDINYLENIFGTGAQIIRVMPNTPAAVGRGISSMVANANVTKAQTQLANHLMQAVGRVVWLDGEYQMNAATAVAGSGPAYVFHLIEAMASAGVFHGLSERLAHDLARATVCGAGELAHQSNDDTATLRQSVTSRGGTTYESLKVLMRDTGGMADLMIEAVAANITKSEALARGE